MDGGASLGGPRVLVVTASDARFMPYLKNMLESLRPSLAAPNVSLACFDIGLGPAERVWLARWSAQVVTPGAHLGVRSDQHGPALRSFLARPFLPEYFLGYDVYMWIDSDVWFQDQNAFAAYVAGALAHDMAVTHERERAYRFQPRLFGWTSKHFALGYGLGRGAYLLSRRHLNAGMFAIRAGAPHWAEWARRYAAAIGRTDKLVPHDQFALNQAVHGDPLRRGPKLDVAMLGPTHNWICDRGPPMWNDAERAFCEPYPPYRRIGALHLAGPAKGKSYSIRRTGGGSFRTQILPGASPEHPSHGPATQIPAAVADA